ncbi:hypothetical protein A2U01_0064069, partial [Trifolium medium]|nr:hypothetical protein [Trifolium medium]
MESTSKDGDKGKLTTKVTAFARRKNAAGNSPKKRSQKRLAHAEGDETAHPVLEHHEGEATQAEHHQADDMDEGHSGHDGDGGPSKVRRPAW